MRQRISQPRRGLASTVVLLALLASAPSAARAAGWVGATPPASAANGPSGAVVAVDPAGDALAAWTDDDGAGTQTLLAAWRPAGGPWGPPQPLAGDASVDAPAVTLDAAGNATVVWIASADGVTFAARAMRRDAASGTWSAPHDFTRAPGALADPRTQVRADASGNAIAAWLEHDASTGVAFVRAAVWSAGAWSAPTTLSDPADAWVADGPPQIAPDASGGALVAWTAQRLADPFDHLIQTRTLLAAGGWGAIGTLLPDVGEAISPLRLVGLAGGDVAATWFAGAGPRLTGAYRQGAGAWNVDPLSDDVAPACVPLQGLGADADGGATVVWKAASTSGLEAARLTSGGPLSDGTAFASATESAEDAAIDRGTVVLVAHDAASGTDAVLATRRAGGGWSAPALLSAGGAGEGLGGVDVATDAVGDALASWTATDALGAKSLAAAAFQAAGPQLTSVSVPASGTAGAALAVSASARSTFASVAQTSWDFGDGTPPLAGASVAHAYAQAGTYTVTATVTDGVGNATQATRQVAIAPAPSAPTAPSSAAALVRPRIGGARGGVLVLARGARSLALVVRNANAARLTGSATLVRPRAARRPALTLASRRGARFAGRARTTLTLRLTDQALRALRRASGFRLPVKVTLHLRAADGRRVSASLAATLDASARFRGQRTHDPDARSAC